MQSPRVHVLVFTTPHVGLRAWSPTHELELVQQPPKASFCVNLTLDTTYILHHDSKIYSYILLTAQLALKLIR